MVTLTVDVTSSFGCENVSDSIIVSITQSPKVFVGNNTTICENESFEITGEADNYLSLEWQSSGDGTFENITELTTTYYPGSEDISSGQTNICLFAIGYDPCINPQRDCMTLFIEELPYVDVGDTIRICGMQTIQLNPTVENYNTLLWTTSGDGNFGNTAVAQTTYQPGSQDIATAEFELCLTALSQGGCDDVTDCVTVKVSKLAIAYAGSNAQINEGEPFPTAQAFAENFSEVTWTTSGSGTFENVHTVHTVYFPSEDDISAQNVTLTITSLPQFPCTSIADDDMILTIIAGCEDAFVDAGDNLSVCEDQGPVQLSAFADHASSLSWSSAGDGTFSEQNILNPEYTLGEDDLLNQNVKLYLFAEAYGNCEPALDSLLISIDKLPVIAEDIIDLEVLLGNQAVFTIDATDVETYEWYGPVGFIPDNNLPVLTIENAGLENAGEYYCVVINSCGSNTSSTVTLLVYEEQIVSFPSGWSGLSSWIDPFDPSVENIFEDIVNQFVILENYIGVYYPGYNINTLYNWDKQDGYKAKFNDFADIRFKGIANTNRTVELDMGWNYLPVVVACPVNIEELFGNISEVEIIKEIAGNGIYWPALSINTIVELMPGNAYIIRVNNSVNIDFADCDGTYKSSFTSNVHRPENLTTWNDLIYTPSTHIIAIHQGILDQLNLGDIIGAFTENGTCAGMMEITMQKNSLTLFADDLLTDFSDGFAENSRILFKVFRIQTDEEFELSVRFDQSFPNADGVFVTNGVSRIIDAELNALSIVETNFGEISLYPNPTSGSVNISGVKNNSTIEIYTSKGQILETITCDNSQSPTGIISIDLSAYPGGIIYFRITCLEKVEVRKVVLK